MKIIMQFRDTDGRPHDVEGDTSILVTINNQLTRAELVRSAVRILLQCADNEPEVLTNSLHKRIEALRDALDGED